MPYTSSPISSLMGQGAPKAGLSSFTPELLGGDLRDAAGLGAPTTAKPKQSLDGTPNGLGKDDFMKLLLVQLSNQDPLKPLEDKEFIAQLAQFNTLEQLQQMNTHFLDMLAGMSLSAASDMIGKTVQANTGSGAVQGVVTAAAMADGKARLTILSGDESFQVAMAQIIKVVGPQGEGAGDMDGTAGSDATDGVDGADEP
jgi:flagellar basal-body rod modification protein FlgD